MLSAMTRGTLLMLVSGTLNTGNLVLSKFLKEQQWPYFRMFGIACLVIAFGSGSSIALTRSRPFERRDCKWVALRGFFGAVTYVLAVVAVYQGSPMGDVATLTSVNMVVAAFLGRLLLGEPLRPMHLLGLGCSLLGAILISKPSFLFPSEEEGQGGSRWVGYLLALASGFFQACVFICSRKSANMSAWVHLCSAMLQCGLAGLCVPFLPLSSEPSLETMARAPVATLCWLALITSCLFCSCTTLSFASRWCPAAVSATTNTTVRMACSYAAQALLFGERVEAMTLAGAALMLASVVVMAGAGFRSAATVEQRLETDSSPSSQAVDELSSMGEDVETESLASFIAAEFVDCSHHEKVRQRRALGTEPVAQQIGAMAAMATVAI